VQCCWNWDVSSIQLCSWNWQRFGTLSAHLIRFLDINVFDLTGWYAKNYLKVEFRKTRLADSWIEHVLRLPDFCSSKKRTVQEAQRMRNYLLSKPLPTVLSEYKNHPLWVFASFHH
jgi:hypothetical protein